MTNRKDHTVWGMLTARAANWGSWGRAPGEAGGFVASIRTKGMLVFCALIAYALLIVVFALQQKQLLLRDFDAIEGTLDTQVMLEPYAAPAALTRQVQAQRKQSSERLRQQSDSVALTALLLVLLGLGLLGAVIGRFLRRLTVDLRILRQRALDIVAGYRGAPLPVTRHDEVGQLMIALNNMAATLDQREKEDMLKRQKSFHQEKMAAIGVLAAGVSHEIGNPIAAICGIAQEMVERRDLCAAGGGAVDCHDCRPELIYAQTERLAAIAREISEFAAPREAEPQFLDLNSQLRSTSRLLRYDKRLQQVSLRLELDSQLPAIYGVADHLVQLVMNLLINAMDALEPVRGRTPAITIATRAEPNRAVMTISDNGEGIVPANLERVFEAFFTTKPAGKGTGLGLSLCYAIVKRHGATIDIDSTPGVGTRVQVCFPLDDAAYHEENPL